MASPCSSSSHPKLPLPLPIAPSCQVGVLSSSSAPQGRSSPAGMGTPLETKLFMSPNMPRSASPAVSGRSGSVAPGELARADRSDNPNSPLLAHQFVLTRSCGPALPSSSTGAECHGVDITIAIAPKGQETDINVKPLASPGESSNVSSWPHARTQEMSKEVLRSGMDCMVSTLASNHICGTPESIAPARGNVITYGNPIAEAAHSRGGQNKASTLGEARSSFSSSCTTQGPCSFSSNAASEIVPNFGNTDCDRDSVGMRVVALCEWLKRGSLLPARLLQSSQEVGLLSPSGGDGPTRQRRELGPSCLVDAEYVIAAVGGLTAGSESPWHSHESNRLEDEIVSLDDPLRATMSVARWLSLSLERSHGIRGIDAHRIVAQALLSNDLENLENAVRLWAYILTCAVRSSGCEIHLAQIGLLPPKIEAVVARLIREVEDELVKAHPNSNPSGLDSRCVSGLTAPSMRTISSAPNFSFGVERQGLACTMRGATVLCTAEFKHSHERVPSAADLIAPEQHFSNDHQVQEQYSNSAMPSLKDSRKEEEEMSDPRNDEVPRSNGNGGEYRHCEELNAKVQSLELAICREEQHSARNSEILMRLEACLEASKAAGTSAFDDCQESWEGAEAMRAAAAECKLVQEMANAQTAELAARKLHGHDDQSWELHHEWVQEVAFFQTTERAMEREMLQKLAAAQETANQHGQQLSAHQQRNQELAECFANAEESFQEEKEALEQHRLNTKALEENFYGEAQELQDEELRNRALLKETSEQGQAIKELQEELRDVRREAQQSNAKASEVHQVAERSSWALSEKLRDSERRLQVALGQVSELRGQVEVTQASLVTLAGEAEAAEEEVQAQFMGAHVVQAVELQRRQAFCVQLQNKLSEVVNSRNALAAERDAAVTGKDDTRAEALVLLRERDVLARRGLEATYALESAEQNNVALARDAEQWKQQCEETELSLKRVEVAGVKLEREAALWRERAELRGSQAAELDMQLTQALSREQHARSTPASSKRSISPWQQTKSRDNVPGAGQIVRGRSRVQN